MSTRARKRARATAAGQVQAEAPPKPPSRSELKNAEARAKLIPLREGERPAAVTASALVTALLLVMNVAAAIFGYDAPGGGSKGGPLIVYAVLLGAMTYGLWRARYWAVLGMQALLALTMLIAGLQLPLANDVISAVLSGVIFVAAGTLFWFLVKAMARIQMPERR
ncbi:MAG TPA: hypothetical protein VE570_00290 [Thermoleophilaceae bacterium]|nr:hypothetical protein [Thermoleophilaceae bacterium]